MLVLPGSNDSYANAPVPTGLAMSKSVGMIPRVYSASRESRMAYGVFSASSRVVSSITLVDWKSMIWDS